MLGRAELERILLLAEPLAGTLGFEILRAEFANQQGQTILRIYLDRPDGITVADCETFSRSLGPLLDVEGGLPNRYHLEISSPGLNRPLARPKHFEAQLGKIIDLQTEAPVEGRKHFKGELLEVDPQGKSIRMKVDDRTFLIPLAEVKKAHLDYFASEAAESPKASRKS